MLTTRQQILEVFSTQLQAKLRCHFRGRVPSAAAVAIYFNLHAQDISLQISQETARRWIRGLCFPDPERLRILVEWIGIDLHGALFCAPKSRLVEQQDSLIQELIGLFENLGVSQRKSILDILKKMNTVSI
ncbi:MAG: hypothetical protein FGM22_02270 [Burkholderiaceae bacterium]|nr:hypothetical protein [Burkholderiaceae bacterium]